MSKYTDTTNLDKSGSALQKDMPIKKDVPAQNKPAQKLPNQGSGATNTGTGADKSRTK